VYELYIIKLLTERTCRSAKTDFSFHSSDNSYLALQRFLTNLLYWSLLLLKLCTLA